MQIKADNIQHYLEQLPPERRPAMEKLRQTVAENIPDGFSEALNYGMIGFVVPHSVYPAGYHCDPKQPLPFISVASQKNFIAFYHMGIYANPELLNWFVAEYPKHSKQKLDMGKSCIRFKKPENIPFELIAELCRKMSVNDWIALYEANLKR
jgi:uncharacterized protein YdhG (YjbR/CyaY superfamily)